MGAIPASLAHPLRAELDLAVKEVSYFESIVFLSISNQKAFSLWAMAA